MKSFLRISALCLSALPLAHAGKLTNTWKVDVGMPLYPEGIAYDAANKRVILSSLTSPVLVTLDASNEMKLLTTYNRSDDNTGVACFGLKMDPSVRDRVWCAAANGVLLDSGKVVAYDIPTSSNKVTVAFEQKFPCANNQNGTQCGAVNDLVFAEKKVAYVTDTALGKVYRLSKENMEEVATGPLLQSKDPPFGANGIVRVSPNVLIVGNNGLKTLVRVNLKTKEVANIAIDKTFGDGPDGLLFLQDKRVVVVTGKKLFVLVDDGNWRKLKVIDVIDIDQSKNGESATTAAVGSNDNEIFITYVRFGDVFGQSVNTNPSLVARVTLDGRP
jgi:sugar lactone lactonase YvrE